LLRTGKKRKLEQREKRKEAEVREESLLDPQALSHEALKELLTILLFHLFQHMSHFFLAIFSLGFFFISAWSTFCFFYLTF